MVPRVGPGGRILIVDGDFVSRSWVQRLLSRTLGLARQHVRGNLLARHTDILSRVHFSAGARAEDVACLLQEAGFTDLRIDTAFGPIHRAQAAGFGWRKSLMRRCEHRYAISAYRP